MSIPSFSSFRLSSEVRPKSKGREISGSPDPKRLEFRVLQRPKLFRFLPSSCGSLCLLRDSCRSSDCELIPFRGVMDEGNRDACEGKKGCFLAERVVRKNGLAPVRSGNFGGAWSLAEGRESRWWSGTWSGSQRCSLYGGRVRSFVKDRARRRCEGSSVGFHDETVLQMRDREALAQRISELEKELRKMVKPLVKDYTTQITTNLAD